MVGMWRPAGHEAHVHMRVLLTAHAAAVQQSPADGSGAVASSLPPEQAGRATAAVHLARHDRC
jgi:hypothetical protein